MATTRLNKAHRFAILGALVKHRWPHYKLEPSRFNPRGDIVPEFEYSQKQNDAANHAARTFYRAYLLQTYGAEVVAHVDALPEGFVNTVHSMKLRLPISQIDKLGDLASLDDFSNRSSVCISVWVHMPPTRGNDTKGHINIDKIDKPLVEMLRACFAVPLERAQIRKAVIEAGTVLAKMRTVEALKEQWPELWPLVPKAIKTVQPLALIEPSIKGLNSSLGLPPS